MNTEKKHGTFISYSRSDKEFALDLARELRLAGYLVWLDQLDIPTGARWDDEVEKALRECEIFLIILTHASTSSENVKDEIGYAIDHGKRILPVLLEECVVPLRLRRFQYVDFTKLEFSEGIRRAKQLLENLLNELSMPMVTINPKIESQKAPERQAISSPLRNKSKPLLRRWVGVGTSILALATCLGVLGAIIMLKDRIFPPTPTLVPMAGETLRPPSIYVPDPLGTDVIEFAASISFDIEPKGSLQNIGGNWNSEWNRQGGIWVRGAATIIISNDNWIYFVQQDNSGGYGQYVIKAQFIDNRLVGRYINVNVESDSTPWVGIIVDDNRIEGKWKRGSWNFTRNP